MDRKRKWVLANTDRVLDYQLQWHRDRRQAVINALGGCCARCGFSDPRALQVDHVHGLVGQKREHRSEMFRRVLSGAYTGAYQLLCANCNWIKRAEREEIGARPRQPRKENAA